MAYFDSNGNRLITLNNPNIELVNKYVTSGGMIGSTYSNTFTAEQIKSFWNEYIDQRLITQADLGGGIKQWGSKTQHLAVGTDDNGNILYQDFYSRIDVSDTGVYALPALDIVVSNSVDTTDIFYGSKYFMPLGTNWGVCSIDIRKFGFAILQNDELIGIAYCSIALSIRNGIEYWNEIYQLNSAYSTLICTTRTYKGINYTLYGADERDLDNTNNTEQGGGYGTGVLPTDNINVPTLPQIDITATGAVLYKVTEPQMINFRKWLWSSDWQDNIKKIRTDPMQNIIGISIADLDISTSTESNICLGNVKSDAKGSIIANSFVELNCGAITLDEYYGTFADYEPFVATTLYLPKVGFVQIPADVVMNNSIKVVYHIELSSGEGLCYVYITNTRDGFSYIWNTYTCHITSNIVLSAQDHTQQLTALGSAIVNTSVAAAGAIANPFNAIASTLSSCIDVATTKNPTMTKGNVGNMSAILCYKNPYIMINRTNLTKPSSFQENNGYMINYTAKINGHTGFLKTRDFHAEFDAPYSHKAEIERLLDEGVFIND